jgi:diguanylate cyclase (GGDEF)-like protein
LFALSVVTATRQGWDLPLAAFIAVPLVVVVARFPMVLDNGDGSIEVGFDSSLLMFLLCTLDATEALAVWSVSVILTQLVANKRARATMFNIGVGVLAGGLAAGVLHLVRGPVIGTPRELVGVALAAIAYFLVDYVLSAGSVALESNSSVLSHLRQRGTWLAIACFVPCDMLGYLGAVVLRVAPWWTLVLLVVPLGTLLVATRAVTRGGENARRLTVLFDAAVAAQTASEASQVADALVADSRSLLRLNQVELRNRAPAPNEIGTQVLRGREASWIVAPARTRARSTTAADQQGLEALAAVAIDAFSRLKLTEKMVHLARYDLLTELPNRGVLLDRLFQSLQNAARRQGAAVALLFLDLDGFKPINDRWGHAAGDAVLQEVAQRLTACVRSGDTVARMGGDEFAVLLDDVQLPEVTAACVRIQELLRQLTTVAGHRIELCASIGITYGDGSETAEAMLRNADLAMYAAKANGKGQFVVYEPAIGRARMERLELIEQLRSAVADGEITVVYQPVIATATRRIVGVEVLARWRNGDVEVPPNVFVHLAEETGLIVALGDLVLGRAADDAAEIMAAAAGGINISVNVAAAQLQEADFVATVEKAVERMSGACLVLEITEREEVGRDPSVLETMYTLARLGVVFAIDDFGVGFSSISYLRNLPAGIIKVDATLSQDIDHDQRACGLLRSITMMGQALGLDVVIEGIERESQLALVRDSVGAPFGQGFLMHRPMPLAELLDVLRQDAATGLDPETPTPDRAQAAVSPAVAGG